jgi:biotin carboxyl carrier protein
VERTTPTALLVREGIHAWSAAVVETLASYTRLPGPSPSAVPVGMLHVALRGRAFAFSRPAGLDVDRFASPSRADTSASMLTAPMPGTVVKLAVRRGERVEAGQTLLVLEAMKMEHTITAPRGGTVTHLPYAAGDLVAAGALLAEVEE